MAKYLLSTYQPERRPPDDVLDRVMRELAALTEEMRAAGAWVFSGPLHPPSTATVLRYRDGDLLVTDGPFTEGKEHLGGFTIVEAPDLDAALDWGGRISRITKLPIEVRPMLDWPY